MNIIETLKGLPGWLKVWILFPFAFLNGWLLLLLLDYLRPFIDVLISAAISAFLLNLPAHFLQDRGVSRGTAIAIVLMTTLLVVGGTALTVGPLLLEQSSNLVSNLPELVDSGNLQLERAREFVVERHLPINLPNLLDQVVSQLGQVFQLAGNQVITVVTTTINSLVNILFFLVLLIFMLIGGESAWDGIFSWIPFPWNETLQASIQKTFLRYFGTQAILAGVLSVAQTFGLVFWDVPYAILFGFVIGISTIIPYAGVITISLVSLIVALQDFSQGIRVLITAIVIGQINDILISPRLMGGSIGLNPIWLIAALFLGGKVGGVLGLIVAVPVASVIKSTVDQLRSPDTLPTTPAATPTAQLAVSGSNIKPD
ncbi:MULTISPECIES: AI-2E family transporter [unclassified Leptolyngbya]|uniref:AI-2E family transporter n=1 Tax=unclassified Leptolyngbya TaxID=2650499 RepID=UPI001682D87A|nr:MULTISPECIES: AI-2E family transporter [unclassified Leptolyngbya]MBD1912072.1 AI-2E family transporter [Leptolyngbya sp. FACHB-8]MBD2153792.1 AI-2E family transporter [Leptolyngbya sp. FACHB-16]